MINATRYLTSNYKKRPGSNNAKLLGLANAEMNELVDVFKKIEDSRDIDKAHGKTLDNAGKNVLEYRNGRTDEEYREHIKIKIIANMSQGDINTINQVAEFFLGDDFLGIEEAWRNPIYNEPAGIIMHVRPSKYYVPSLLKRIKAGGVSLYWESLILDIAIKMMFRTYEFDVPYKICNRFITEEVLGGLAKVPLTLKAKTYSFDVLYPICNTFVTSSIAMKGERINVTLVNEYRNNDVLFKRVGSTRVGEGDI